jgi:hypothetical protein
MAWHQEQAAGFEQSKLFFLGDKTGKSDTFCQAILRNEV